MMSRERGCGFREQNGLYATVESSINGFPIENFIFDPVRTYEGEEVIEQFSRSPTLFKDGSGIYHMVMWIGKQFYPYPSDFIEEAKVMGISKRLPKGFDFSQLTPNKSWLLLVHPRSVPLFNYRTDLNCPKEKLRTYLKSVRGFSNDQVRNIFKIPDRVHGDGSLCLGDTWAIGGVHHVDKVHEVEGGLVSTPSATYRVNPIFEADFTTPFQYHYKQEYQSGIILWFPKWNFEYVNNEGLAPEDIAKPLITKGWNFKVVDE